MFSEKDFTQFSTRYVIKIFYMISYSSFDFPSWRSSLAPMTCTEISGGIALKSLSESVMTEIRLVLIIGHQYLRSKMIKQKYLVFEKSFGLYRSTGNDLSLTGVTENLRMLYSLVTPIISKIIFTTLNQFLNTQIVCKLCIRYLVRTDTSRFLKY